MLGCDKIINNSNTVKKRVRMEQWQREFRLVKWNPGGCAEDGFGVALPNCDISQISDDRIACYSEKYKFKYIELYLDRLTEACLVRDR